MCALVDCLVQLTVQKVSMCITYYMLKRILVDPTSNIRSSQRLSHACLSTYLTKVKPQKAQYNSCNFLDHIPSTWITVENLELIHALMRVL